MNDPDSMNKRKDIICDTALRKILNITDVLSLEMQWAIHINALIAVAMKTEERKKSLVNAAHFLYDISKKISPDGDILDFGSFVEMDL